LKDFTEKYTKIFFEDLAKLKIDEPTHKVPISTLIPEMTIIIQKLLDKGYAYLADD